MVKINDPRCDTAAIAMRSLRANNMFKTIKKIVKKSNYFDEDKLDLYKTDKNFYNEFVSCPESIKQELLFLWEEVGNLNEELENKQNQDLDNNPKPPKRICIMGP